MNLGTRLLLIACVVSAVGFIIRLVRARTLRGKYAIVWLMVAAGLGALAVLPETILDLADTIGVEYEPALFFGMAVTFLLLVVVHFSWELSRTEARSRRLAEDVALLRQRLDELDPPPPDPRAQTEQQ